MHQHAARTAQGVSSWRWGAWLSLLLLLSGCGARTAAVPWADQLRTAQAAARAHDPAAVLSEVATTTMFLDRPLVPATVAVLVTFHTSTTADVTLRYDSADSARTMALFSTGHGSPQPPLPAATIAAIQHSPAEVIAATWEEGQRYVTQRATAPPDLNTVRVKLVTTPAYLPPQVSAPAAWEVHYAPTPRSPERELVFWVDVTTGAVLFQQEVIRR